MFVYKTVVNIIHNMYLPMETSIYRGVGKVGGLGAQPSHNITITNKVYMYTHSFANGFVLATVIA